MKHRQPELERVHEKDRKSQAAMGGHVILTIGLQRAKVTIGLMNVVNNMKRLIQLIKRNANVAKQDVMNHYRKGAPVVA